MPSIFLDYAVPTRARNHTLHDTTPLVDKTIAISVVVTTAGILIARMWGDSANVEIDLGIGTHYIPGNWKLVLSTGTTAVLTGTRCVCYIAEPSGLNV